MKIVLVIAGAVLGAVVLLTAAGVVRGLWYQRSVRRTGWNIRHDGLHVIRYSEFVRLNIEEIVIDGEILVGTPHHALYIYGPAEWDRRYPDWAHGRRDEIVRRIRSKCPDSEYEYHYLA